MPPSGAAAEGGSGVLAAVILIAAVLVVIGVIVKLFDRRRQREAEAVHVQAQIAEALLRDPQLFGLPVTPTAHVPWKGSPVTVELRGQLPSEEARDTVLRIARQEAARIRPDFVIDDQLLVVPAMARV
jgi:hypothetical protein